MIKCILTYILVYASTLYTFTVSTNTQANQSTLISQIDICVEVDWHALLWSHDSTKIAFHKSYIKFHQLPENLQKIQAYDFVTRATELKQENKLDNQNAIGAMISCKYRVQSIEITHQKPHEGTTAIFQFPINKAA